MTDMIYLLRHGETEGQGEKRFVGQSDIPLNQTGIRQAHWWQKKLGLISFDTIRCSHLSRCAETARIIAREQQDRICIMSELGEIRLGEWEGLPMSLVRQRFPEKWEARGRNLVSYRPPGGESFADLRNRVIPAFEEIIQAPGKEKLIIAHAGVNRVILCHVLGMPISNLFRLGQDYGALNTICQRENALRVTSMNRQPDIS